MNKLRVETCEIIQKIRGVKNQTIARIINRGRPFGEDGFFPDFIKSRESRMGIISVSGERESKEISNREDKLLGFAQFPRCDDCRVSSKR